MPTQASAPAIVKAECCISIPNGYVMQRCPVHINRLACSIDMPHDYFTHMPLEILQDTLRFLDSLDFLCCRQVNSRLRCGIESLPEYQAYRETHRRTMKLYYEGTRKKGAWKPAGIRRFLDLMRTKHPPSDRRMLMVLKCYLAREMVGFVGSG